MQHDKMVFGSLAPVSVEVEVDGKRYLLKEAGEGVASEYQSMAMRGATFNTDTNKIEFGKGLGEQEPWLVSQCLWECNSETGQPLRLVSLQTIKGWPSRYVRPLFDKAKEISGIAVSESPERKALLAALSMSNDASDTLNLASFREWVSGLLEIDHKLYHPLWDLVKPKEEADAKN